MSRQQAFEAIYAKQHDVPAESLVQYRHKSKEGYSLPGIASHYRTYCMVMDSEEIKELRKDAELHQQIQRAAKDLPSGWEIRVCVEHESGYVELWDQDGCEVDFPNSCESLALTVSDAIDGAMSNGDQP